MVKPPYKADGQKSLFTFRGRVTATWSQVGMATCNCLCGSHIPSKALYLSSKTFRLEYLAKYKSRRGQ